MAFALRLIAPMVLGLLPQDPPTAPPTFSCSPGPFERTWALVDATLTPRAPSSLPLGELDRPAIWSTWAVQLRAATTGTPAERAQGRLWVAAFAAAQGRSDDAWSHLAAAGEDPAGLLAVLPMLAPGVAAADLAAWPRLPSGALLTPALPPPAVDLDEILLGNGRVRPGEVSVREFRVGDARLALSLGVEGDGVQIELAHLGGGPTELELIVPVPPDFELGSVNLDWERVSAPGGRLRLSLEPGGEPRLIYGRYRPRRIAWPTSTPESLSTQARRDGLVLWVAADGAAEGLRAGLAQLLGLEVRVRADAAAHPGPGVVLDLREPSTRNDKRNGLVSLAERYALAHPR